MGFHLEENFQKKCRLCGKLGRRFTDIFTSLSAESKPKRNRKLSRLIYSFLRIQVKEKDFLPKKVCDDCIKKLTVWQNFYNMCKQTQRKLLQCIENQQKSLFHSQNFKFTETSLVPKPLDDILTKENDTKLEGSIVTVPAENKELIGKTKGYKRNKIKRPKSEIKKKQENQDAKETKKDNTEYIPEKHSKTDEKLSGERKPSETCQCKICEKEFPNTGSLKRHIETHLNCDPVFQCDKCGKKFRTKFSLRSHLDTHSESPNYCCHQCGNLFHTASGLCNHARVHNEESKRYVCLLCGKQFRQTSHLEQHKRTHTGEKPYPCSECAQRFKTHCHLSRHIQGVHRGAKKHKCGQCGKEFLYGTNFRAHMLGHAGQRNNVCNECGKTFLTANALFRHRRSHTGDKPFECDICGKKFADCSNRKRHILRHTQPPIIPAGRKSGPQPIIERIIPVDQQVGSNNIGTIWKQGDKSVKTPLQDGANQAVKINQEPSGMNSSQTIQISGEILELCNSNNIELCDLTNVYTSNTVSDGSSIYLSLNEDNIASQVMQLSGQDTKLIAQPLVNNLSEATPNHKDNTSIELKEEKQTLGAREDRNTSYIMESKGIEEDRVKDSSKVISNSEVYKPKTYENLRTFLESPEVLESITGGRSDDTEDNGNVEYVTLIEDDDNSNAIGKIHQFLILPSGTTISNGSSSKFQSEIQNEFINVKESGRVGTIIKENQKCTGETECSSLKGLTRVEEEGVLQTSAPFSCNNFNKALLPYTGEGTIKFKNENLNSIQQFIILPSGTTISDDSSSKSQSVIQNEFITEKESGIVGTVISENQKSTGKAECSSLKGLTNVEEEDVLQTSASFSCNNLNKALLPYTSEGTIKLKNENLNSIQQFIILPSGTTISDGSSSKSQSEIQNKVSNEKEPVRVSTVISENQRLTSEIVCSTLKGLTKVEEEGILQTSASFSFNNLNKALLPFTIEETNKLENENMNSVQQFIILPSGTTISDVNLSNPHNENKNEDNKINAYNPDSKTFKPDHKSTGEIVFSTLNELESNFEKEGVIQTPISGCKNLNKALLSYTSEVNKALEIEDMNSSKFFGVITKPNSKALSCTNEENTRPQSEKSNTLVQFLVKPNDKTGLQQQGYGVTSNSNQTGNASTTFAESSVIRIHNSHDAAANTIISETCTVGQKCPVETTVCSTSKEALSSMNEEDILQTSNSDYNNMNKALLSYTSGASNRLECESMNSIKFEVIVKPDKEVLSYANEEILKPQNENLNSNNLFQVLVKPNSIPVSQEQGCDLISRLEHTGSSAANLADENSIIRMLNNQGTTLLQTVKNDLDFDLTKITSSEATYLMEDASRNICSSTDAHSMHVISNAIDKSDIDLVASTDYEHDISLTTAITVNGPDDKKNVPVCVDENLENRMDIECGNSGIISSGSMDEIEMFELRDEDVFIYL